MKLVDDVKATFKHYSTIALGIAGSLQTAWLGIPDAIRDNLPKTVGQAVSWITVTVVVGGLAGKFIDQSPKVDPPKDAP